MKTILVSLLPLLLFSLLWSAPLRDAQTELKQPDGSVYSCFMTGDEYYHRAHDSNGFTIIKNQETGWHVYAQKQGRDLSPTSYIPGRDDPAARGLTPHLLPDESILRQRFQNWRGANRDEYGRAPTTGTIANLCIFIRFMGETEFGQSFQTYNDMHNSTTGASMRGYFLEESAGQLTVNSTFYPTPPGSMVLSWQDTNPRNYYYPQSAGNPIGYPPGPFSDPDMYGYIRLHTMFVNAVNAVAPMIPPNLNIDSDNNGKVDNLSFICRGNADATSAIFWPHYWVMDAYPATPLTYINYMGIPRQADDYNFSLQYQDPLYIGYGGGIDAAEISHEFSHTLGFPDLYHYTWDGVNPCGYWDLMDHCYQVPQHHLAYLKWKYGGWFTTLNPLPAAGTAATLNAVATSPFDHYVHQMPTGEQIWIEYRQAVGLYETRVPGSGLVIYRVNQTIYPWGNAGGPPDEVYVYRPYVSLGSPDGNINMAHYAWDNGLTAINMFTDPAPFSQSMPGFVDPQFNIHSVGSQNMTGSTMPFVVGTVIPNIWTGAMDQNWLNGANWSMGTVPLSTDFVIVAWSSLNVCSIPLTPPGMQAVCQELRVEAQLNMTPGAILQVNGHLNSIGRIFMDGNLMQVIGNLTIANWYAGSWFMCQNNLAAQIQIGGNCLFDNGTNIQLTVGQLIFANIGVSPPVNTFTCDSFGAVMFDLIVNKTGTTLSYNSTIPGIAVNILGALNVNANSTLTVTAPHFIHISGNLNVATTGLLQVQETIVNTFNFVGPPALQTITINNPNCYLNHLSVQNNAAPMLASNLAVRGNFSIMQGAFIANNNTISVRGNWVNNVGLGGFQKGTSRVIFNGPVSDQTITVSGSPGAPIEDFHILELNKAMGSLNMNTSGQQVQCDFYDWTSGMLKVTDGQFSAFSLLDGYVAGNITCNAPGLINLTDTGGNGDLNANLSIQGGILNVHCPAGGPGLFSLWGAQPISLIMTSGQINYPSVGVHIVPGPVLTTNITGGTINVAGDFQVHNSGFTPTGGNVVITSSLAGMVAQCGTAPGSWFHDLDLQSQTDAFMLTQVNGTLTVNPGVAFGVHNNLNVNNLQLMGSLNCFGPITANVTGTAVFPAGSMLSVDNATFNLAGIYPISLDGGITINDGWLNATNHTITINPIGSIQFGLPGPGLNGKLSCATLTANHPGNFIPTVGTLELKNTLPSTVYALSITNGNQVNHLDVNIQTSVQLMTDLYVLGNLHIISGQLVMDNTGRTIYMQGNWTNDLPGTGFVRGNSIVNFSGSGTVSISANGGTEQFYTLDIGSGTVILMDNVSVANLLNIITSTLQVNGQILSVTGNTTVNSGGNLDLDSGSVMEPGNGTIVSIMGGASFQSQGVAGNNAEMRGIASGTWYLRVLASGNISVKYTTFKNLRVTGVTVMSGAVVDLAADFDNCVFRDGAAGCTYLTVNNNQTLNITGISFPTSVPGGYNIAKTANSGTVNVLSSSGIFAGPLYENDTYARINWTGYDPNLIVQSFIVSVPNPYVADQVSYSVTIKNDSPHPVQQTFKIHLFKNRTTPPGWTETGDYNHICPTLAPNATHSYTFTGVYSMTAENWTSWLLIDPEGAVLESNEYDNRDSESITWQALPTVSNMTVTQTGTNTARITWTYPIWATRYRLYDAADPYGTFSYVGSTTNLYYDVSLASGMRFYLIKAERDAPAK